MFMEAAEVVWSEEEKHGIVDVGHVAVNKKVKKNRFCWKKGGD